METDSDFPPVEIDHVFIDHKRKMVWLDEPFGCCERCKLIWHDANLPYFVPTDEFLCPLCREQIIPA